MTAYSITPHERVEVRSSTAELLAVDSHWTGAATLPPPHLHPGQDERFEVQAGRIRAVVGGVERVYAAGEAFDVPRGTPHAMAPDGGEARARWEIRPALGTEAFWAEMSRTDGKALRQLAVICRHPDEFRLTGALGLVVRVCRALRLFS